MGWRDRNIGLSGGALYSEDEDMTEKEEKDC